jgi:hypothetical protein
MTSTDKRWGGKRRPRITMPRPVTRTEFANLFKVVYKTREGKSFYNSVVAVDAASAAKAVATYSKMVTSVTLTEETVRFSYHTYDIQYRGEHQDLLRSK